MTELRKTQRENLYVLLKSDHFPNCSRDQRIIWRNTIGNQTEWRGGSDVRVATVVIPYRFFQSSRPEPYLSPGDY